MRYQFYGRCTKPCPSPGHPSQPPPFLAITVCFHKPIAGFRPELLCASLCSTISCQVLIFFVIHFFYLILFLSIIHHYHDLLNGIPTRSHQHNQRTGVNTRVILIYCTDTHSLFILFSFHPLSPYLLHPTPI